MIKRVSVRGLEVTIEYSSKLEATEVFKSMLNDIDDGGTELCFMTTKSVKE